MAGEEIVLTLHKGAEPIVREYCESELRMAGYRVNAVFREEPLGVSDLQAALKSAAGYIVGLEKVDAEIMAAAPALKAISKFGVGTDNIDVAEAHARGIAVSNCPGSNSNAVAELAVGLMVALARNTHVLCDDLRSRKWSMDVGSELAGKCVSILGFGNVGRRLASYLRPFGATVLVYDSFRDEEAERAYGVRFVSLDEAAARADFISVHLPLLPETRHLLGDGFFGKTKRGVFVLNLARGGIVDERALLDAVRDGRVLRAATDVFEAEPPFSSALLEDDRIIVLPHIGAATKESTLNMLKMAIENVRSVLEGKGNPHPVGVPKA